jgi:hypothetical protein
MIDLADGRTRVEDAAALMGLQRRQVYRLLDAFRAHGPDGASALLGHRYTVERAKDHAAGSRSGMHPSASRTSASDHT